MRAAIAFGATALLASVGLAFALTNRASASSPTVLRPGPMRVRLLFKPALPGSTEAERDASRAIARRAFAALPGAFMGKLAVEAFSGEHTTAWLDPQGETEAIATFSAQWPHDRLGPIKEDVRKAVEASLRAYVPQLTSLTATRVS
jgi:hypothetical protein